MAILASTMANGGVFNGTRLLSESTWRSFHSDPVEGDMVIGVHSFVKVSSGQVRSGEVRSGQVMPGQVRSGQVRSGQVRFRSGQVRSGQVRSGQVRSG